MANAIEFEDENGRHVRAERCTECFGDYYGPRKCECGGKFHCEIVDECCTEDYSDCWNILDYRCDKCGSESLDTETD